MTNAASFRAAAAELRRIAEMARYRRYAHAHKQMADSLDAQAAELEAVS